MTNEELEKKAENYAEEQEKNCILGVYDDTTELEYDEGYNKGYVSGLEEGYFAGAKAMQEENEQLKQENKRAKVLLKATLDLLQKQKDSYYVLNLLENTAFYDDEVCDGYCLFDDIENLLNFGS